MGRAVGTWRCPGRNPWIDRFSHPQDLPKQNETSTAGLVWKVTKHWTKVTIGNLASKWRSSTLMERVTDKNKQQKANEIFNETKHNFFCQRKNVVNVSHESFAFPKLSPKGSQVVPPHLGRSHSQGALGQSGREIHGVPGASRHGQFKLLNCGPCWPVNADHMLTICLIWFWLYT